MADRGKGHIAGSRTSLQHVASPPAARAYDLVTRAVEVRVELLDPGEALTCWELVNSIILRGKILVLSAAVLVAPEALSDAWSLLQNLGSGADGLRNQLRRVVDMAERTEPEAVQQKRRAGQLPR